MTGARVSPHTFCHQFGKTWVMNGGDPFSLQLILGHTTQEMVSQYVNLTLADVQKQHSKFSPADSIVVTRAKRSIKLR